MKLSTVRHLSCLASQETGTDAGPGRSFGVLAKKRAPEGYIDLDSDDYKEDDFMYSFEQLALNMKL